MLVQHIVNLALVKQVVGENNDIEPTLLNNLTPAFGLVPARKEETMKTFTSVNKSDRASFVQIMNIFVITT